MALPQKYDADALLRYLDARIRGVKIMIDAQIGEAGRMVKVCAGYA